MPYESMESSYALVHVASGWKEKWNNLDAQSQVKKLKQQLKEAQEDLDDTKRDHAYDMQSQGFDKLSEDLKTSLDDTEYEISHNADKQLEIINSMLDKAVSSYWFKGYSTFQLWSVWWKIYHGHACFCNLCKGFWCVFPSHISDKDAR